MGEKGARLTSDAAELHDAVLKRLAPLGGIKSRKMFGGFGIFHDRAMFGLISKTTLFFKVDETNRSDYEKAGSRQHRPMPYWSVPESVLARKASLQKWALRAISVAQASAKPTARAAKKK